MFKRVKVNSDGEELTSVFVTVKTRDRIKVRAAKMKLTMMELVEMWSKTA